MPSIIFFLLAFALADVDVNVNFNGFETDAPLAIPLNSADHQSHVPASEVGVRYTQGTDAIMIIAGTDLFYLRNFRLTSKGAVVVGECLVIFAATHGPERVGGIFSLFLSLAFGQLGKRLGEKDKRMRPAPSSSFLFTCHLASLSFSPSLFPSWPKASERKRLSMIWMGCRRQ